MKLGLNIYLCARVSVKLRSKTNNKTRKEVSRLVWQRISDPLSNLFHDVVCFD